MLPGKTTFGIEAIFSFDKARKFGFDVGDIWFSGSIPYDFELVLWDSGHTEKFGRNYTVASEIDLRDKSYGGQDDVWADSVDLFFIFTHGNNKDGIAYLLYNVGVVKEDFQGDSSKWKLGNKTSTIPFPIQNQAEWLMIYGCHTIDKNKILGILNVFQRLHEFCGAYGDMWDSPTTDEVGEEVAENLTDGDTVASAWIDGVSDWVFDNHPMIVAAENKETYNNGDIIWSETTLNKDHIWGEGTTVPDIFPNDIYYLSYTWAEG